MKFKILAIAFVIIIFVLVFFIFQSINLRNNNGLATITIAGKVIQAEIADTYSERAKGLMFRKELAEGKGMLFVFENEQQVSFWMKNTLIPLDLIFIDKDFKIVDIKQDFQLCQKEVCPTYSPKKTVKYVLEVNSGFIQENGVKIGDKLEIL